MIFFTVSITLMECLNKNKNCIKYKYWYPEYSSILITATPVTKCYKGILKEINHE